MKGYATTNSPYARKVRVAAIETNQNDLIDWEMITREERAILVPKINPLGKVPVVVVPALVVAVSVVTPLIRVLTVVAPSATLPRTCNDHRSRHHFSIIPNSPP